MRRRPVRTGAPLVPNHPRIVSAPNKALRQFTITRSAVATRRRCAQSLSETAVFAHVRARETATLEHDLCPRRSRGHLPATRFARQPTRRGREAARDGAWRRGGGAVAAARRAHRGMETATPVARARRAPAREFELHASRERRTARKSNLRGHRGNHTQCGNHTKCGNHTQCRDPTSAVVSPASRSHERSDPTSLPKKLRASTLDRAREAADDGSHGGRCAR
jgi:hypothetical protein